MEAMVPNEETFLRDVGQACLRFETLLKRDAFISSPADLFIPECYVLRVLCLLHGQSESEVL